MPAGLREEVVEACRRLTERGLIGAGEGNVSARTGGGEILLTPSGRNKGHLVPSDLLVVSERGRAVAGRGRPTSELALHLAAYEARPDVRAVVHAHPLAAVAHTLAGRPIVALQPEAAVVLGERVPVAPYAVPGTRELGESVRGGLAAHDVILLERHGALAVGRTPLEAADRLEILERVALASIYAELLGGAKPLPPEAIEAVRAAAKAAGLTS